MAWRLRPEESEAILLMDLFKRRWPKFGALLIHLANERRVSEGRKGAMTHGILKRMGFQPGLPDYFLAVPRTELGLGGMFLELKAGKNTATPTQLAMLEMLSAAGYHAAVATGADEAMLALEFYLEANPTGGPINGETSTKRATRARHAA